MFLKHTAVSKAPCLSRRVAVPVKSRKQTLYAPLTCLVWALQEFVLFLSTEAKKHELIAIVPLDLLREIRSMYHLVTMSSRGGGKLDKHVRQSAWTLQQSCRGLTRNTVTPAFCRSWRR